MQGAAQALKVRDNDPLDQQKDGAVPERDMEQVVPKG